MTISKSEFLEAKKGLGNSPYTKENITRSKKRTLEYLSYRIKRPLLKLKYRSYQKENPTHPWLSPDSIKILERLLNKNMVGLEYGSGRSTLFFSDLFRHLTSVEHNKQWHNQVTKMLISKNIDNVSLNLILADTPKQAPKLSSEWDTFVTKEEFPVKDDCYQSYINFIDLQEDNHFDFILIDGRARVSCSLKSIDKLKAGGLFVLDNSERRRYAEVHNVLKNWPSIYTTTGLTDTTIWRKP